MPFDRSRYPENWPEIREWILLRAGGKCERCGVPNHVWIEAREGGDDAKRWYRVPERFVAPVSDPEIRELLDYEPTRAHVDTRSFEPVIRVVLTIAHVHDETPSNVADENLEALCQLCHNRLDAPRRAARRRACAASGDLFGSPEGARP